MTIQSSYSRAKSLSLGVTVVLLYAVFVTAVFSGFASYIYRTEWQSAVSQSTQGADLDNLLYILKREGELQAASEADYLHKRDLTTQRAALQADQKKSFAQISQINAKRERMVHVYLADVRKLDALLDPADQRAVTLIMEDPALGAVDQSEALLAVLGRVADGLAGPDKAGVVAVVTEMQTSQTQLATALREANDAAHEINAGLVLNASELEELLTRANERQKRLSVFQEQLSLGASERARLDALTVSVPFVGDLFQRLVSFPTIFLTLIVTIAAGGLGTVVSFSRRYYADPEEPNLSRLFVNVGEGIAAAIAIFLFSGAGMLALTQGSGAQTSVELSPYTVAFVAFLSGFMAEEAFGSIQKTGKKLFSGEKGADADPDRVPDHPHPHSGCAPDAAPDVSPDAPGYDTPPQGGPAKA